MFVVIALANCLLLVCIVRLIILRHNKAAELTIANLRSELESVSKKQMYSEHRLVDALDRNRRAFVGSRVMVRSNENEPIFFGKITRFLEVSMAKNPAPVIIFEGEEAAGEKLCFAAVMPYNELLLKQVENMSPKEQWEFLKDYAIRWD